MRTLNENLSLLQRSGIRRFTNLAKEVPDCVMLTIGEPDYDTPQSIRQAAAVALERGRTHYAPNQGTPELRNAIAGYESSRGMACKPEQVLVTVGATGALYTALTGILNPGDEVIIPTPAFSLYESITLAAGAKPVYLDLAKEGFQITHEALSALITPRTKAIILNSPNNPTGAVLSEESLAVVRQAVLEGDFFLICDNVYNQLCYGPCPDLSLDPALSERLFLCQSFSKPYAMTGWRVGYLVGPEKIMERLLLLHAAQVAAVPTFVQDACIAALETDVSAMKEAYRCRRDLCVARLTEMGLKFPHPQGAFYVFADIRPYEMDSEDFCTRAIKEAGVAMVPGSCFGAEGFVRLSYCCEVKRLEQGLERLKKYLETL